MIFGKILTREFLDVFITWKILFKLEEKTQQLGLEKRKDFANYPVGSIQPKSMNSYIIFIFNGSNSLINIILEILIIDKEHNLSFICMLVAHPIIYA